MNNEQEAKIYNEIKKYFEEVAPEKRRPSSWRVSVGASSYDDKEVNAVLECLLNGRLSVQKKVAEFEQAFADYSDVKFGIATNSGTSALILAFQTLLETKELGAGDEVIVPATTFISDVYAILKLGLIPVYVDVEKDTFNIDPVEIEKAIDPKKTKAVIAVHTLGLPADMDKIMAIAKKHNLKVIEDCCEAHGASYKGKKVGQFSDMAVFSFYVAHNMTTWEGGIVLTNSDIYSPIVAELKEFGRLKSYKGPRYGYTDSAMTDYDERYVFHRIGYNFRMADPPAAFGLEQLKKLDALNLRRIENAKFYKENFEKTVADIFSLPTLGDSERVNVFYGFPLAIKQGVNIARAKLTRHLESKGIETRAILCGTLPDQPGLRSSPGRTSETLKVSRWIRDNAFFIGCHPELATDDLKHAVNTINEFCSDYRARIEG